MSQYQDLIIPDIEIHEIGKLITPKPERKIFSKESSVQRSDPIATKVIPEIIPLIEPQVLSEDIGNSIEIDLKNFDWRNFDKVNCKIQIKLLHEQLILAFEEIIKANTAIKRAKTKTNCIFCCQVFFTIILIPVAICAIIAIIFLQHFS